MKIDLNELAIFDAIVTTGSFTKAALLLDMPKSTVSRKVMQLENSLKTTLLVRNARIVSLTSEGKAYHQYCAEVLSHIHNAELSIQDIQKCPKGRLRIAMPLAFDTPFIINTIGKFCQLYPEVNIDLKLDDRNLDLIKEGIDITFRTGPLKDSTLVASLVAKTPFILCASSEYLQDHLPIENLDDLAVHSLVCHNQFMPWKLTFQEEPFAFQPSPRYTSNDIGNIHKLILGNLGIGPIPKMICSEDIQSGKLKRVLPQYEFEDCDVYLVYPARHGLSNKVSAFREFFIKESQLQSPWSG